MLLYQSPGLFNIIIYYALFIDIVAPLLLTIISYYLDTYTELYFLTNKFKFEFIIIYYHKSCHFRAVYGQCCSFVPTSNLHLYLVV